MKNRLTTISLLLSPLFIAFILVVSAKTKAQTSTKITSYFDPAYSVEKVIVGYHNHVNDTFNEYMPKMLKGIQDPDDDNGKPLNSREECESDLENYSTYCVANRLLGDPTDKNSLGYLNFKAALLARSDEVVEKNADHYQGADNYSGVGSSAAQVRNAIPFFSVLETALTKNKNIDREIKVSKQALDQALSAYDQLRMAWPMHKQYVEIFDSLKSYRDKLVQLREKTDIFPSRFVDVSTAKCT